MENKFWLKLLSHEIKIIKGIVQIFNDCYGEIINGCNNCVLIPQIIFA